MKKRRTKEENLNTIFKYGSTRTAGKDLQGRRDYAAQMSIAVADKYRSKRYKTVGKTKFREDMLKLLKKEEVP